VPSDFLEVVAVGYRPSLVRFGIDDFSLSVSIPVIMLANDIPPRALMAWDRRLLSRTQHLTLLISGLRGTYPPLKGDGTYSHDAAGRGSSLQFKVGLTRRYRPSKEHALEVKRNFGLVDEDPQAWSAEEQPTVVVDAIGTLPDDTPVEQEEDDDEGRFDTFSLSNSLESLLDQSLVRVIQTRLKYGLGWAGAETLVSESEKLQHTADHVLASSRKVRVFIAMRHDLFDSLSLQVIEAADKAERKLAKSYKLPADPLTGRENADDLNLPLVAFCYLVRRLTVCLVLSYIIR
jgi:ubiquitin-conjugating enzyme E2 Q